jgi:uncharacterized protein (DUF1697 family)
LPLVCGMSRQVAFLRGINVGGRSVTKQTLLAVFESLGLVEVSTFKQSGNVIFQTAKADTQDLTGKIEAKLQATLGYPVAVFIRTTDQLKSIIESDPFKSQPTEGTSFLVTFLPPKAAMALQLPLTIPKSTAQVISTEDSEVFSVTHGGGEGALPNPFIESKLKIKATTRNLNVVRDIVAKFC